MWALTTMPFFIRFMDALPGAEAWRFTWVAKGRTVIYLPWQMVFYLVAGTVVGIVVSVFTRPAAKEKLDNFYALTRAPIAGGEKVGAPCTLPEGAVVSPRRNLLPFRSLEIPVPSWTSVIGFLIGWAAVAALIGVFVFIASR